MPGNDTGREDAAVRSCGYPQVRTEETPRGRLALWLLTPTLPILVALCLLKAAGMIGPGMFVMAWYGSWAALGAAAFCVARPDWRKENGDA